MSNVMDWKSPNVFKKFDIPKGVNGNFKAKYKHCTAIIVVITIKVPKFTKYDIKTYIFIFLFSVQYFKFSFIYMR